MKLPIPLALLTFTLAAHASETWTQFRGPNGQGHSEAKGLPLTWSETEHVKWKTEIPGEGWSSPVVADGKVWMTTALEDGKSLHAVSCDLASGKLLCDVEVFRNDLVPPKHRRNSYASPTPVIEGDRVYVHFGSMGTACLSAKDGTKLWENREFIIDTQNGPGGSPALWRDRLIFSCDGTDQQFSVALDKMTGKVLWKEGRSKTADFNEAKRPTDMRKAYGTPVVFTLDGRPQILTTAAERLYAQDPETGKEIWWLDHTGFSNVPLVVGDGRTLLLCTSFNKAEIWAVRGGDAKGDVSKTHVLWRQNAGAPAQSSPLLIGERVYMVSDSGIASCLDVKDGRIVWKKRLGSDYAASPFFADGRIYFWGADGLCTVVAPKDEFEILAKNELAGGFMATPAIAGRAFIVRTKTHLYRIE